MAETVYIPFSEWLPDQFDTNNMGLEIARNCLPKSVGFGSFPSFVRESTNAIAGDAKGLFSFEDGSGTAFQFVGDETKLYRYTSSQTFEDVSRAGDYAITDFWDFTTYGNRVIATNYVDVPQSYIMALDTDFSDLGGTPPSARYATTIGDFVILANVNDGVDGDVPFRFWNSARRDPTDWTVSAQTQCGYQDIPDSGGITGFIGGSYGIAFTSFGVHRITYIGSPRVWDRKEIGQGIGCDVPGSIIRHKDARGLFAHAHFLSKDGFAITDGATVRQIGHDRVNEWFFARWDQSRKDQMTGGVFGERDCAIWSFPSILSTGMNDSYIAMNMTSGKWAYGEIDVERLGNMETPSILLDEIEELVDNVTDRVDSSIWDAAPAVFGAIDHEGYFGSFVGPALAPEFVTGDYRLIKDRRSRIGRIWPSVDGTVQTQVRSGDRPKNMGTYTPPSSMRRGFTSHRSKSKSNNLSTVKVTSSGAFTEASGATVEVIPGGN